MDHFQFSCFFLPLLVDLLDDQSQNILLIETLPCIGILPLFCPNLTSQPWIEPILEENPVQVKLEIPDYGVELDPVGESVQGQNGVKQEVLEEDRDAEDVAPLKRRRKRKRARVSMAESSK